MKKTKAATAAHISNIENVLELNSTTVDESMLLNIFSQFRTIIQILNYRNVRYFTHKITDQSNKNLLDDTQFFLV